jgi:hypothetical protein
MSKRNDNDALFLESTVLELIGRRSVVSIFLKNAKPDKEAQLRAELDTLNAQIKEYCDLSRVVYDNEITREQFSQARKQALLDLATQESFAKPVKRKPFEKEVVTVLTEPVLPVKPVVQLAEFPDPKRVRSDFEHFCKHALQITYRPGMNPEFPHGGSGPFILNHAQKELWALFAQVMFIQKKPLRLKILKARQLGCTTYLLAFWVWMCLTQDSYHVMFIIDKDEHNVTKRDMVIEWLKRIKEIFPHLPKMVKREGGVVFLSNRSKIFFESAQAPNPGTSEMIHVVHESEKPKWPAKRALEVQNSVLPGLPDSIMTVHVDESTAVGMDAFYEGWTLAMEQKGGEDSYVYPVFLPWHISPEYAIPSNRVLPDYANNDEDLFDTYIDEETGENITLNEEQYAQRYHLRFEQILWRRHQIKRKFNGNRSSFDQEYPTTPEHAWRNVASTYFAPSTLKIMARNLIPPSFTGRVVDANGFADHLRPCSHHNLLPKLVDDKFGELKIWEAPEPGMEYYAGVDISEGKTVAKSGGENEPDESFISIKNKFGSTVAVWHGRCRPEELWLHLILVARLYNMAWINGERNSVGYTVLMDVIKTGYPNNFYTSQPETRPIQDRMWTVVGSNRPDLLAQLRASYSRDPKRIFYAYLYSQIEHFINKMIGAKVKPQAAAGFHDDGVMAEAHSQTCRLWRCGGKDIKAPVIVKHVVPTVVEEPQKGFKLSDCVLLDAEEWLQ